MSVLEQIKAGLDRNKTAMDTFIADGRAHFAKTDQTLAALTDRIEDLESRRANPGRTAPNDKLASAAHEVWLDRKSGERIPVLGPADPLTKIAPNNTGVPLGRWLRGVLVGRRAEEKDLAAEVKDLATTPDASGGYTVPSALAGEFIDALRAAMVLNRAGARTVPMPTKQLTLARIDSDPGVAWHAENASITPTEPTFGAAILVAKTVVCVTKLSLELSQDAPNIEAMLTRSITGAMAAAIDKRGLLGNDGSPTDNGPNGVITFNGRNRLTSIGGLADYDDFLDAVGKLIGSNVPLENIGPIILGTQAYIDLAKAVTGITSDKTKLAKPPALTQPFLPTTAANSNTSPMTSTAFMADWRDLLFGVRRDITIRVLNEAVMASNLQLAVVAYARCDFQPARAASFATLEGITH